MTTTVKVHPHGHHVRITTTDAYAGQEPQVSTVELAPGDPEWSGVVTDTRTIKVEEYVPAAATDADHEQGDAVAAEDDPEEDDEDDLA